MKVANKRKGEAEIVLDGETYILKMGFNEFYLIEEELKTTIAEIFQDGAVGVRVIRTIIYACLRPTLGKRLTPEKVGDMLNITELEYYGQVIAELVNSYYQACSPKKEIDEGNSLGKVAAPQPQAVKPTGTGSNALPTVVELDANFGL